MVGQSFSPPPYFLFLKTNIIIITAAVPAINKTHGVKLTSSPVLGTALGGVLEVGPGVTLRVGPGVILVVALDVGSGVTLGVGSGVALGVELDVGSDVTLGVGSGSSCFMVKSKRKTKLVPMFAVSLDASHPIP